MILIKSNPNLPTWSTGLHDNNDEALEKEENVCQCKKMDQEDRIIKISFCQYHLHHNVSVLPLFNYVIKEAGETAGRSILSPAC